MAAKPKAVFDINIYISAVIFGGAPRLCLELARKRRCELYVSQPILLELAKVLARKFGWPKEQTEDLITGLINITSLVEPREKIRRIKNDLTDNSILEAALAAKADCIVSGDKRHLLPLKKFRGIQIVTAAEFLKVV